jgi:hypothetical protein
VSEADDVNADPRYWCSPCPPCPERLLSNLKSEFLPNHELGAWVFIHGVRRRVSWQAEFIREGTMLHDGEMYAYTNCPWCGGDLPAVRKSGQKFVVDEGEGSE